MSGNTNQYKNEIHKTTTSESKDKRTNKTHTNQTASEKQTKELAKTLTGKHNTKSTQKKQANTKTNERAKQA